jgi:polyisoprenoid-binding protein YceI
MKKPSLIKMLLLAAIILSVPVAPVAQTVFHTQVFNIKLSGTSNLHDWDMTASAGTSEAAFIIENGKIISLSKMNFSLPAKNLKSGHGAMDKNTYKALKTDANPNISFVLTSATVTSGGGNNYKLSCKGQMTIAGKTNQTNLAANGIYDPADKSLTVSGVQKMKMTDYGVTPPKALLGTLKTGNDISITYNVKFKN